MTNVIHFDNAKNTEMPSSDDRNLRYSLSLEDENFEYKMLVAELALKQRKQQSWGPVAAALCAVVAFVLGWMVDPPLKLWVSPSAAVVDLSGVHGDGVLGEIRRVRPRNI